MAIKWLDAKRLQGSSVGVETSTTHSQLTTNDTSGMFDERIRIAQHYTSGNVLLGKEITSVTFYLTNPFDASGAITCSVYNSSGTLVGDIGIVDADTIGTSGYEAVRFPTSGDADPTQTLPSAGGYISVSVASELYSSSISSQTHTGDPVSNEVMAFYYTSWSDQSGVDMKYSVNYNTYSPDKDTVTDVPNGTIFNETDTYKYFMFDGTDTWNQMVSS